MKRLQELVIPDRLRVINIGLEMFADNLRADGIDVVHVDWRPPTGGDSKLAAILSALEQLED